MTTKQLHALSVREIGEGLRSGRFSAEDLTRHLLARIKRVDPQVHAFIALTEQRALDDARRADRELASGHDRGLLHGIPIGLKDLYDCAGIPTTCCSRLRLDHVPAEDSEVSRRLAAAGAVLLGKLTTVEFAMVGPDFDLPFPPARNPWNTDHITSGSSSGSGAAIAAGLMRISMGSDTIGSIRGPAAACGIAGLQPTYGRVSLRGVFPLANSLDHAGPMARTVEDTAILLQAVAGHDPADPLSADQPVPDYLRDLDAGVEGLRIAWPRRFIGAVEGAMPEIIEAIEKTAARLVEAGAVVEEVELPDHALFTSCANVITLAEAFDIHGADFRSRPQEFGPLMMSRTIIGGMIGAEDYVRATRLRGELVSRVDELWGRYDALLAASAFATAARFDGANPRPPPLKSQWALSNVSGIPAMSVPVGLVNGLPIGVTIMAGPFDEAMVLRVGRAVEELSGWMAVPAPDWD